jgi:hypothetical protein
MTSHVTPDRGSAPLKTSPNEMPSTCWALKHRPLSGRAYHGQISFVLWARLDRYLAGLEPSPTRTGKHSDVR